ncbi:MAG TPA: GNAT family N-acetyltransferase, partial [Pseudosphingobacterium sp.]|nr:GNAT family N-acetyltransferase [Pseudosphingobacterium sp.]
CTSVYGYSGPISNVNFASLPIEFLDKFYLFFLSFLHSQKIVSIFSVLHPLSDQQILLNRTESLHPIGKTVAINLRLPIEEQRLQYRRPIRLKINQLRRKGFTVRLTKSLDKLHVFAEIYRENMIKVGASDKYIFDDKYFEEIMGSADFDTELLLAYYQEEIVAGAMMVFTNNIVQLHLAGTRNEFLKESPMKLIFDEASLIGRAREMHYLHLGSGVGGKEDSLFHFKRGFSDCLFDFTTWRYIVNPEIYNELVLARAGKVDASLFPLYRFVV